MCGSGSLGDDSEVLLVPLGTPNSSMPAEFPPREAKVQLPDVGGVESPSSALWKSPKSPNDSKDPSSSEKDADEKLNPPGGLEVAESENGPNPS